MCEIESDDAVVARDEELVARGVDREPVRSFLAGRLEKEVIDCHTLSAEYLAAVDQPSAIDPARLRARTQRNDRVVGLRSGSAAYESLGRYSAQLMLDIRCFELAVQIDQQPDCVEVHVDRQRRRATSLRQTFLRLDTLEHRGAQPAEALGYDQPRVPALLQPFIVLKRKRSFLVVNRGALGEIVGHFARHIEEALLPRGMNLIH